MKLILDGMSFEQAVALALWYGMKGAGDQFTEVTF